jgi:replicative DNA helicase
MTSSIRIVRDEAGPGMSNREFEQIASENPQALLPDRDRLASQQMASAVERMNVDSTRFPRFARLKTVHALAGAMAPGELWMFGARPGNGKSLFLQNLHDDLIDQEIPTLYIGLEQGPDVLRIKLACVRAGVNAKMILKPDAETRSTTDYRLARERVDYELATLNSPVFRELAFFAPTPYVNRVELEKWTTGAVRKYGAKCVIVDHIDHMDNGSGRDKVSELTETVKAAKMLARKNAIPMLVASQVKRPGDAINAHTPPAAEDLAGSAGKEQIADVVLTLWRPLRLDLDAKSLRNLVARSKLGPVGADAIYEENTMGVRLGKDRLGSTPGKQAMLTVKNEQLTDRPEPPLRDFGRYDV